MTDEKLQALLQKERAATLKGLKPAHAEIKRVIAERVAEAKEAGNADAAKRIRSLGTEVSVMLKDALAPSD